KHGQSRHKYQADSQNHPYSRHGHLPVARSARIQRVSANPLFPIKHFQSQRTSLGPPNVRLQLYAVVGSESSLRYRTVKATLACPGTSGFVARMEPYTPIA